MLSLVFSVLLYFNPFKIVMVLGNSMYPTLKNGNILLAKKTNEFQKNDIVIAKDEYGDFIIKRIKYEPGDYYYLYFENYSPYKKIFLENNSYVLINQYKKNNIKLYEYQLSKNQYFLLGDNLNNSDDSRRFGSVDREDILYKVIR